MRQAEKEEKKKILDPNSVPTQPELENFKKNCKKIQKIEKVNSGIISIQNGLREAEKERKKFQSRIPFILKPGKKIPKKRAKKFKKLKTSFRQYFQPKQGTRQAEKAKKTNFSHKFRSFSSRARKFRKKGQKNSKN